MTIPATATFTKTGETSATETYNVTTKGGTITLNNARTTQTKLKFQSGIAPTLPASQTSVSYDAVIFEPAGSSGKV